MDSSSDEIKQLGHRVAEMQAQHLLVSAQIRALMLLSAKIWRDSGVPMPGGKPFEEVFQTMADEQKDYLLSAIAGIDPKGAAQLKHVIEKSLKGQDPFE